VPASATLSHFPTSRQGCTRLTYLRMRLAAGESIAVYEQP
jgi:hypothetical protein